MKLEDLIWDIRHMLMALSETTTVYDGDLIDKLAFYRMGYINKYWLKNQEILEDWFQFVDNFSSENWDIFANPLVEGEEQTYVVGGQTIIPKIISFPNHASLRLTTDISGSIIYPINYREMLMLIELNDKRTTVFNLFSPRNNKIYTYPKKDFIMYAILQEPTKGKKEYGEDFTIPITQGDIVSGVQYKVISGTIQYNVNGILTYLNKDQIFVGNTGETTWVDLGSPEYTIDMVSLPMVNGELIETEKYIIETGIISHYDRHGDLKIYYAGQMFEAASGNWTDIGDAAIVRNTIMSNIPSVIKKADTIYLSYFDEYPLDVAGAQEIILQILTQDYKIRMTSVTDVLQDDQDQFKILNAKS